MIQLHFALAPSAAGTAGRAGSVTDSLRPRILHLKQLISLIQRNVPRQGRLAVHAEHSRAVTGATVQVARR